MGSVGEAAMRRTAGGLEPAGPGWFVLNAGEACWWRDPRLGSYCPFEAEGARFPALGVNLHVLRPGEPNGMYHGEPAQEDFLVLRGECLLIVEGRERLLRAWDFVHCPPGTDHVFVGAGTGPCLVLMIGARGGGGPHYPVAEAALRHGAGVERATDDEKEAYAPFGPLVRATAGAVGFPP